MTSTAFINPCQHEGCSYAGNSNIVCLPSQNSPGASENLPGNILVVPRDDKVVIEGAKGVIYDVDENIFPETLEKFHDGPRGRFALAVIDALGEKGIQVTPASLEENGLWNREFRKFGGLLENQWFEGLADVASNLYKVEITPVDIEVSMTKVLRDRSDEFKSLIQPDPKILGFMLATKLMFGDNNAICTTSAKHVMEPLMGGPDGINERVPVKYFSAIKKVKDPDFLRFSEVAIDAIVKDDFKDPFRLAVMTGDSIADYGAAAAAGLPACVLRVPQYAIDAHGGVEAAVVAIKRQVEQARRDNKDRAEFDKTTAVIVESYDQVLLGNRHQQNTSLFKQALMFTILGYDR